MPQLVSFSVVRDAGDENRIFFSGYGSSYTFGPNSGSLTVNLVSGGQYSLSSSGSGPGSTAFRINSATEIGLDDRQGAGADGDYNDLILRASRGFFFSSGGSIFYQVPFDPVVIDYFRYTPEPQTSGTDGIPDKTVTLQWGTTAAVSVVIDQGVGTVPGTWSEVVDTGLQSVAGSLSPATKTYTLTATGGAGDVQTAQVTVSVYNDNTPNNYTVPSITNAEPNSQQIIDVGTITGIDMATAVSGSAGVDVAVNDFNFANNKIIRNGDLLRVRVFSLPFNTSPNGLTNTANFHVDVGTVRRTFSVTTRAPRINENFDYANKDNVYPFPKIDTTSNTPSQYILSDSITLDDVELSNPNGVEIRVDKPDAQIKINNGSWTDVRQI